MSVSEDLESPFVLCPGVPMQPLEVFEVLSIQEKRTAVVAD